MRQDRVVRRTPVHGGRGQERGLEPSAVLVGAFEVHHAVTRLAREFGSAVEYAEMRDARIEPDVEDVGHLLVPRGLVAEQFGGIERVPGVDTGPLHPLRDLLHQLHAARMRLLRGPVDEQRNRHAPGALARNAPVRAPGHHSGHAFLAPCREPVHVVADRFQRRLAQSRRFHADEPLRRGAERDRRLVPPAMRVAVRDLRRREQHAAFAQQVGDRVVRLPDELAFDQRRAGQVDAVAADRVQHAGRIRVHQAVFAPDREILHAMTGCRVHRAGALLRRHVRAEDERDRALVERMPQAPLPSGEGLG